MKTPRAGMLEFYRLWVLETLRVFGDRFLSPLRQRDVSEIVCEAFEMHLSKPNIGLSWATVSCGDGDGNGSPFQYGCWQESNFIMNRIAVKTEPRLKMEGVLASAHTIASQLSALNTATAFIWAYNCSLRDITSSEVPTNR
jgi:hypothetical protein